MWGLAPGTMQLAVCYRTIPNITVLALLDEHP